MEQSDTSHEPTPVGTFLLTASGRAFPEASAAEEAALEEFRKETRRGARNFRITDEHLGEGGPARNAWRTSKAIQLLKYLEEKRLSGLARVAGYYSGYVGWGGIPECSTEQTEVKGMDAD